MRENPGQRAGVLFRSSLSLITASFFVWILLALKGYVRPASQGIALLQVIRLSFFLAAASLVEEILFRGLIYDTLKRIFSDCVKAAAAIESVFFALAHAYNAEVVQSKYKAIPLLAYFAGGVYFTIVYERSKSVGVAAFIHFLNNALSTFAVRLEASSVKGSASSLFFCSLSVDSPAFLASELFILTFSSACILFPPLEFWPYQKYHNRLC